MIIIKWWESQLGIKYSCVNVDTIPSLEMQWQHGLSLIIADVCSELENGSFRLTTSFALKCYFKHFPKSHKPLLLLFLIIKVCRWIFPFSGAASFVFWISMCHCSVNTLPSAEALGASVCRIPVLKLCFRKRRKSGCRINSSVLCFLSFCGKPNYLFSQIPMTCNQCYEEVQQQMDTQVISNRLLIVSPSLALSFLCVHIQQFALSWVS